MKIKRKAKAVWYGTGKDGKGELTTKSKVLDDTPYSFSTRFEKEKGTNPEELIGAAHAGCYTMKLAFLLSNAGYEPTELSTKAEVIFEDGQITTIELRLKGEVPEITENEFNKLATEAKETCPVSMLLNAKIELEVELK